MKNTLLGLVYKYLCTFVLFTVFPCFSCPFDTSGDQSDGCADRVRHPDGMSRPVIPALHQLLAEKRRRNDSVRVKTKFKT